MRAACLCSREQPDLDALRGFIARCRHSEGGYGVAPGQPATLQATYFATIILRWTRLMTGRPAAVETAGFVPLFNGKDLSGWEGDTSLWSVRDGAIVGKSTGLDHNEFLATEASYGDFVLKLTFRVNGDETSNSGVQLRSVRSPAAKCQATRLISASITGAPSTTSRGGGRCWPRRLRKPWPR